MPRWLMPPVEGLIEPIPAPEIYVDDIGAIEIRDGIVRIYSYAEELSLHGGPPLRVVKLIVRGPLKTMGKMLKPIGGLDHIAGGDLVPAERPCRGKPRLVDG